MLALVFDTETTGLIHNRTVKLDKQPHTIEFYGCKFDLDTGEILDELDLLIKPPQPLSDTPNFGDKKTTTQITGITNEMLASAPSFAEVSERIFTFVESAELLIAHNLSYDKEMLEIEAERLNRQINWPQGLCTVEQTVHLKGHRLSLIDLYKFLFNDETFAEAHRARNDTQALLRCAIELNQRGLI